MDALLIQRNQAYPYTLPLMQVEVIRTCKSLSASRCAEMPDATQNMLWPITYQCPELVPPGPCSKVICNHSSTTVVASALVCCCGDDTTGRAARARRRIAFGDGLQSRLPRYQSELQVTGAATGCSLHLVLGWTRDI
eukprot:34918-Pleurochrysis_carterae.AAC.1